MTSGESDKLLKRIAELEDQVADSAQWLDAIKNGEVDAFAIYSGNSSDVYTLQTGDYAYRLLIEEIGEGAVNLTEEGLIVYTNKSFCELIQNPYEKIVASYFFEFVAEESRDTFNGLFQTALNGRSNGEINLKHKEKRIPVYISLTSLQPKLPTVGIIITDFTYRKKNEEILLGYQNNLESKNQELLQTNAELASFSYIASHDLQEPLRKIQTFSNRILDKEGKNLSDQGKDYFKRIISASNRMQNLIAALLNYSRTNTSENFFTITDLNIILEDVKLNLKEMLEEAGAVIESSPLPVMKIIPHQFSQLFSNVLSNAVKYRKPEVKPRIKISADVVAASQVAVIQENGTENYWKISIKDNGLGFEPQYADKIFELFQRLHTRNEFEGTGIGLAICKKIIQNHHGHIEAEGEPGKGSTFHIYLPINKNI